MEKIPLLGLIGTFAFMLPLQAGGAKVQNSILTPNELKLNPIQITSTQDPAVAGIPLNWQTTTADMLSFNFLDISPDGQQLAYITYDGQLQNVVVRPSLPGGTSDKRTDKNVVSVNWGTDGYLYFSEGNAASRSIWKTDAQGSNKMLKQVSVQGNWCDDNPCLMPDGKSMLFSRNEQIYELVFETGVVRPLVSGANPNVISGKDGVICCQKKNAAGKWEIWIVDSRKQEERKIVETGDYGVICPKVSPDGKWVLYTSFSGSGANLNSDICATNIENGITFRITDHQAEDICPVWAGDGRSVYFISNRGDNSKTFNVWRMNMPYDIEDGMVRLKTSDQASIKVDGVLSMTNFIDVPEKPGKHHVEVIFAGNQAALEQDVEFTDGSNEYSFPIEGTVSVTVAPVKKNDLYLDNVQVGATPMELNLLGNHSLSIKGNETYYPYNKDVFVNPFENVALQVELEKRPTRAVFFYGANIVTSWSPVQQNEYYEGFPTSAYPDVMVGYCRDYGVYAKVGLSTVVFEKPSSEFSYKDILARSGYSELHFTGEGSNYVAGIMKKAGKHGYLHLGMGYGQLWYNYTSTQNSFMCDGIAYDAGALLKLGCFTFSASVDGTFVSKNLFTIGPSLGMGFAIKGKLR